MQALICPHCNDDYCAWRITEITFDTLGALERVWLLCLSCNQTHCIDADDETQSGLMFAKTR